MNQQLPAMESPVISISDPQRQASFQRRGRLAIRRIHQIDAQRTETESGQDTAGTPLLDFGLGQRRRIRKLPVIKSIITIHQIHE